MDRSVVRLTFPGEGETVMGRVTVSALVTTRPHPQNDRCMLISHFDIDAIEFMPPRKVFVPCAGNYTLVFNWNTTEFSDGTHSVTVKVVRRATTDEAWFDRVSVVVQNSAPAPTVLNDLGSYPILIGVGGIALIAVFAFVKVRRLRR